MIESGHDDDLDFEFDGVDEVEHVEPPPFVPPAGKRRKRPRMGQVVKKMGRAATASPVSANPAKVLEQRQHAELGQRILQAGKNKGEQKGYGAASGRKEMPPIPPEGP